MPGPVLGAGGTEMNQKGSWPWKNAWSWRSLGTMAAGPRPTGSIGAVGVGKSLKEERVASGEKEMGK